MPSLAAKDLQEVNVSSMAEKLEKSGLLVGGQIPGKEAGKIVVAGLIGGGGQFRRAYDGEDATVKSTITAQTQRNGGSLSLIERHLWSTHMWDGDHYIDLIGKGASGNSVKAAIHNTSEGAIMRWHQPLLEVASIEGGGTTRIGDTTIGRYLQQLAGDAPNTPGTYFGFAVQDEAEARPAIIGIDGDSAEEIARNYAQFFSALGSQPVSAAVLMYDTQAQQVTTHIANS